MSLRHFFCRLLRCRRRPTAAVRWRIAVGNTSITFIGDFTMGFKIGNVVPASVEFLTAAGAPAKRLDGIPQWTVDDASVASVEAAADGMSAKITALTDGSTTVRVTADADLDEGEVREVGASGTFTVDPDEADSAKITFGAPL